MRCIDCLGEATIQVISPEGMPVGTFCAACWEANRLLHEAFMAQLADAAAALGLMVGE